jgi:glycosyltransferase involved in cell wall biosynthesis
VRILLTVDPEIPVPPRLYGGIERVVDSLARALKQRAHTVALLSHPASTSAVDVRFAWPGATSRRLVDSLRNASTLRRVTKEFKPDVIHSFSRLLYLLAVLDSPVPRIMSFQRLPTRRTIAASARLAGDRLAFTGCSDFIRKLGQQGGGEWVSIPNFVEVDCYTPRLEVDDGAPLVFLSRVERIKGTHMAIAVARRTGRRLLIAGNRVEGDEHERYWSEQIAPHLGRDGIEYVGSVDDSQKNELLRAAAALLVPIEWNEPFGIVFAEALACGTPVISCPRGALPEIIRQGREGFLASDLEQLCEAVRRLPEIDRRECRRRAETTFSAAVVSAAYERLYRRRLTGEGSGNMEEAAA